MAKKLGMKSRLIWIFSKTQTVTMLVFFLQLQSFPYKGARNAYMVVVGPWL